METKTVDILPNFALIKVAGKTADIISISSKGICGEDVFGYQRLKKVR
jgi:hypothetical protein